MYLRRSTPKHWRTNSQKKMDEAQKQQPGTDGYYIANRRVTPTECSWSGVHSAVWIPRAFVLRSQIQKLVSAIHPQAWDPQMTVGYSGI